MIEIIGGGIVGLWLLLYHPGWVLLGSFIVGGFYIFRKYDLTEIKEEEPKKEFTTYEEKLKQTDAEHEFKEGFENDAEWQARAKAVREHIEKARALADDEMSTSEQNVKNMA